MGRLSKLCRRLVKSIAKPVTKPFTRSARHKAEDAYKASLEKCAQQERAALQQLELQAAQEHKKINEKIKELEQLKQNNAERYSLEKSKLERGLEQQQKEIEKAKNHIRNTFDALRAGLEACQKGQIEIVESILKKGGDIKARFMAFPLLHLAAGSNQVEIIRLLCRHGADLFGYYETGETPLEVAQEHGKEAGEKVLQEIIQETIRFWEAVDNNNLYLMQRSLEQGAAINSSLPDGANVLKHVLIDQKPYTIIHWLVEAGVDLHHPGLYLPEPSESTIVPASLVEEGKEKQESTTQNKNVLLSLSEKCTYDWRIRDYIFNRLHSKGEASFDPVVEWLNNRNYIHLPGHLTFSLTHTYKHITNQNSVIITVKGSKRLFSLGGGPSSGLELVSYDFEHHQWLRHFILDDMPTPIDEVEHYIWNKKLASDRLHYFEHNKECTPIQIIKTEDDPENLYLIMQSDQGKVALWHFDASQDRYKLKPWYSLSIPQDFQEREHSIVGASTEKKEALFLFVQHTNDSKFWSYSHKTKVWKNYNCDINNIASFFEPQLAIVRDPDGINRVFVLLQRISESSPQGITLELWSFEPEWNRWISHGEVVEKFDNMNTQIQMKKIRIEGKPHLFILTWPRKEPLFAPKLYQFDCEKLAWKNSIDVPGVKFEDSTSQSIAQLETIPDLHTNTDILILLKLNANGLNSFAYNPRISSCDEAPVQVSSGAYNLVCEQRAKLATKSQLERRGVYNPHSNEPTWLWLHQNYTDQFKFRLQDDPAQKIQMHIDIIHNQYHIILFSADTLPQRQAKCVTIPIDVLAIEQEFIKTRISKRFASPDEPFYIFSDFEVSRNQLFLNKITKATQNLLESASRGDWGQVVSSLDNGADIYATDEEGSNALQLSVRHAVDLETLNCLIAAGFPLLYRNKQGETAMDIAKKANHRLVHDYLAGLLNRPSFEGQEIDPTNSGQVKTIYLQHLRKAEAFINSRKDVVEACQWLLRYFRLLSATEPCSLYIWPGMILLAEILSLLPKDIDRGSKQIGQIQNFFAKTRAMHKTLTAVGFESSRIITELPEFCDTDWSYITNTIRLQEIAEQDALKHNLAHYDDAVIKRTYTNNATLAFQGIAGCFQELAKAIGFDQGTWNNGISHKLVEKLSEPMQFKATIREQFKEHFSSMATTAKEAQKAGVICLRPALNAITEFKYLAEEENVALAKCKELEAEQQKELDEWLQKAEQGYLRAIDDIANQINLHQNLHADIDKQIAHARADLQAQFAQFRTKLAENKEETLRQIQNKAFKSLVIMAAACVIANFAAPLLAPNLTALLPTTLGISKAQVAIVLKGAIMGGINGGFSRQNVLKATLKGAAFAAIGCAIGEGVGAGLKTLLPNLPANSEMFARISSALTAGIEATVRTTLERGPVGKNIITSIGTGLLLDKTPSASDTMGAVRTISFMAELQGNLIRAFAGGAIHAVVHKQDLGTSLLISGITAGITTGAERLGTSMAAPFLQRMEHNGGTKTISAPVRNRELSAPSRHNAGDTKRRYDRPNAETTHEPRTARSAPATREKTQSRIHSLDTFLADCNDELRRTPAKFPVQRQSMQSRAERALDFFIPAAQASESDYNKPIIFAQNSGRSHSNTDNRMAPRRQDARAAGTALSLGGKSTERFSVNRAAISFRDVGIASAFQAPGRRFNHSMHPITFSGKDIYTLEAETGLKFTIDPTWHDACLTGFGRSIIKTWQGVNQLGLGIGEKFGYIRSGTTAQYTKYIQEDAAFYNSWHISKHWITRSSEFAGDFCLPVILPGGAGLRGLKLVAGSAATGAFLGGIQSTADGSLRTRMINISVGAGLGVAGGVAGAYVLPKVSASLINKVEDTLVPLYQSMRQNSRLFKEFPGQKLGIEFVDSGIFSSKFTVGFKNLSKPVIKTPCQTEILTQQKIVDYLEKIHEIPRPKLISDLEAIGLTLKGGSKDGRFMEFTDRHFRTRVKIHPPDNVGTNYHHIHIYDRLGHSLNRRLDQVSYKSYEAHIKIRNDASTNCKMNVKGDSW